MNKQKQKLQEKSLSNFNDKDQLSIKIGFLT